MSLLAGRTAVVTGGGSGIGAATCRRFVEEGARVAVLDIDGDRAEKVAGPLDALPYAVDVTDYDALAAAVADARAKLGGISILYNNAGGSNLRPLHEYPIDEWQQIVTLNLSAVFYGMKVVAPIMLEGGGGAIVSTASISGHASGRGRSALRRGQGGGRGAHRVGRARVRADDPRQRGVAGDDPHRDDRTAAHRARACTRRRRWRPRHRSTASAHPTTSRMS